jgi:uncharacterized protein (TIGR02466 family)
MNLHNMFTEFSVADKLNLDLSKITNYCYTKEKTEDGAITNNTGQWQSKNIVNDPEIQELKDEILRHVQKISEYIGRNLNLEYVVENMWININRKNHFDIIHDHPGFSFSGTFYVKFDEDCGNIVFTNPNSCSSWAFKKITARNYTPYNSEVYSIFPEENLLVIFPSSVKHYVEPNLSDHDRISISFNVRTKYD